MAAGAVQAKKAPLGQGGLADTSELWPRLSNTDGQFDDAPQDDGAPMSAASRELYSAGLSLEGEQGNVGEKQEEEELEEEEEEDDGEEEVLEALDWVDLREGERRSLGRCGGNG